MKKDINVLQLISRVFVLDIWNLNFFNREINNV